MNASIEHASLPSPARAPVPARGAHRFRLLLRREYWEHKGGVFWAPAIAGALSLLLSLGLLVVAIVMAHRAAADGNTVLMASNGVTINGLDLGALVQQLTSEDMRQLADGLYVTLFMAGSWPFLVMMFVAFFYCLGALYDDRKDRSVLFWKSLPISDGATVLSKVVTAVIVIPLVATLLAIATMLLFLVAISLAAAAHGANPLPLLWGNGSVFLLAGQLLAAIPVYAAWALPTVGWLMLCSAWARSKPFLWAVLIPLALGAATSMFNLPSIVGLDRHWLWSNVIARMLLGTVPLTGNDLARLSNGGDEVTSLLGIAGVYSNFATPAMWAGVVAGVLMLLLAVRLRRWREEG